MGPSSGSRRRSNGVGSPAVVRACARVRVGKRRTRRFRAMGGYERPSRNALSLRLRDG